MADAEAGKGNGYDIFVVNRVYSDPAQVFQTNTKSVDEVKDECVVVLDTNALLVPFAIGKQSLEEIEKTCSTLVKAERLVIPGQVAREFARHRPDKLSEVFQQLSRKRSALPSAEIGKYPLLASLDQYQDLLKKGKEIDALVVQYRDAIGNLLESIRKWNWNDPVSMLYGRLFSPDVIMEPSLSEEALRQDLYWRQLHKIPPGYKDSSKEDDGIGDLLIWHSILRVGAERKASVLFVSGEEKPDWWHRSENQTIYPRYELVDEFRRHSGGQSFHIVTLSRLLDLFGAGVDVVEEVRSGEAVPSLPADEDNEVAARKTLLSVREASRRAFGFAAEMAVWNWLRRSLPPGSQVDHVPPGMDLDLVIHGPSHETVGIIVQVARQPDRRSLLEAFRTIDRVLSSSVSPVHLILIYPDAAMAVDAVALVGTDRLPLDRMLVGFLAKDGEFSLVAGNIPSVLVS